MKELGVKHVEPYYIKVRRYSFFKRASILVTKDGGISLENYIKDFRKHEEWFKYFFDTYIYLAKNGIYCTDYNPDGMLVNEKGELLLIDFDAFKTKIYLTKKYKRYLIECLMKNIFRYKQRRGIYRLFRTGDKKSYKRIKLENKISMEEG